LFLIPPLCRRPNQGRQFYASSIIRDRRRFRLWNRHFPVLFQWVKAFGHNDPFAGNDCLVRLQFITSDTHFVAATGREYDNEE
jgi:hypothetical protein